MIESTTSFVRVLCIMEDKIFCTKCKKDYSIDGFYFDKTLNKIKRPCLQCCRNRYKAVLPNISTINGEVWKDVINYEEHYQISSLLRLKSLYREVTTKQGKILRYQERIMKPALNSSNYLSVVLSKNGKPKSFLMHRLVAIAFIPQVEGKLFVNHIDGNTLNNSIENLEWCTHSENVQHGYNIGQHVGNVGENHSLSVLNEDNVLAIRRLYRINPNFSRNDVANKFGVTNACIGKIIMKRTWKHVP